MPDFFGWSGRTVPAIRKEDGGNLTRSSGLGLRSLALVSIIVLGAVLRLSGLGDQALWLDEAYSWWFANRDWHVLWQEVPAYETHPVAWYSALKLWLAVGQDEATMRLLPALTSVAIIPVAYLIGRLVAGTGAGLLAAFLIACSPFNIHLAQELRPYSLLGLASALLLLSAARIVARPRTAGLPPRSMRRQDPWTLAAFGGLALALALVAWSHNVGFVPALTTGLFLLGWGLARGLGLQIVWNLALAAALAAILYLPNLANLLGQFGGVAGGWWLQPPGMDDIKRASLLVGGSRLPWAWAHPQTWPNLLILGPLVAGAMLLLAKAWRDQRKADLILLLLASSAGPFLLMLIVSHSLVPLFMARTLSVIQPALLVLLALGPIGIAQYAPRLRQPLALAAGAFFLVGALSYHALRESEQAAERQWRVIAAIIAKEAGQAPVFLVPNALALPAAYYTRELPSPVRFIPLPAPYPAQGRANYPAGGKAMPAMNAEGTTLMVAQIGTGDSAWLVARRADNFDPQNLAATTLSRRFACRTVRFGKPPAGGGLGRDLVVVRFHGRNGAACTRKPND